MVLGPDQRMSETDPSPSNTPVSVNCKTKSDLGIDFSHF